jgi:hypothetical protein
MVKQMTRTFAEELNDNLQEIFEGLDEHQFAEISRDKRDFITISNDNPQDNTDLVFYNEATRSLYFVDLKELKNGQKNSIKVRTLFELTFFKGDHV